MEIPASRALRGLIGGVNLAWTLWAMIGGYFFLTSRAVLTNGTSLMVFDRYMHGYNIVGLCLLGCGLVSLVAALFNKFKQAAAILCAVWCGTSAVFLMIANPGIDQGDIDGWLLILCAVSCVARWALIVLEPHVTR